MRFQMVRNGDLSVGNDYLKTQSYFAIDIMSKISENPQMILKIVFVGDSGVGKTSLIQREAENHFTQEHLATIGVDFRIKTYQVGKISVKAQLWDTAGQERFRSIQKPYYRNSNAIMLCFSLCNRESFVNLTRWLDEIKGFDVQGQIYLVGCKSDLDNQVPTDEILTFAEAYGVSYIQTSAKDSVGVEEGFKKVIEEAAQANLINMAFNNPKDKVMAPIGQQPPKKQRCC